MNVHSGNRRTATRVLVAAAVLASVVAACGSDSDEGVLEGARESGVLKTAFVAARPVAFVDEDAGEATGSGIDLVRGLASSIDIADVETIFVTFDAMIPGLEARRWDMSAFPFFITAERCDAVAFTDPVAKFTQGALVAPGNPLDIHGYDDLADNDKIRIATQAGSAEAGWAKDAGVPDSRIQSFPEERLAIEAVRQGRADVYLQAAFSLTQVEENYGVTDVEVATPFAGPIVNGVEEIAYAGFALRHEDVDLLHALNKEIAALKSSGELLEIQAPYGYTEVQMPEPDVRAKDLCPDAPWK
jgi:polar amino acid transport system substrate-binding protein